MYDEWIHIENNENIEPGRYFRQIEEAEKREIYLENLEKLKESVGVFKNAVDGIITKLRILRVETS
uniref:Uncharacterized protein n=1 Tax=Meloidogyne enterolobii TaxID=390850 RepID=A0A6V7XPI3_MELEN|nr:unnamed protein product [Meloidogyne enterolobii]